MPQERSFRHEIRWSSEKSLRLWEFYSENLPKYEYFGFHSGSSILNYVARQLKLSGIRSILDFGCGPGYLIPHLIKACEGKVYGLDFSKEAIKKVVKKFGNHHRFGGAICVEELPSPFKDSIMELVISVEVVEHLHDKQLSEMLLEVRRLLKRGGYVVITTPNNEDLQANKTMCPECGCIFHRWQHTRTWNVESLRACFEKHGFQTFHVAETLFRPRASFPVKLMRRAVDRVRRLKNYVSEHYKPHLIYIGIK